MQKKLFVLFVATLLIVAAACGGDGSQESPTPSYVVDVLRLDTPTPAPTPKQETVYVNAGFEDSQTFLGMYNQYVRPMLAIHGGWSEPENISAEEFGRFFLALGGARRGGYEQIENVIGYVQDDISEYLQDDRYLIPSAYFCDIILRYFKLSSDYLLGMSNYDIDADCFVIPADEANYGYAEVYRLETHVLDEPSCEYRIRYRQYNVSGNGMFYEDSGRCYELCVESGDYYYQYVSSTPVSDDKTLPPPENGQSYISSEISNYYSRRGITVSEMNAATDDLTLVYGMHGPLGTLEIFDRSSGDITAVASFIRDETGKNMLVSPPFDSFETARLGAYAIDDDGSVRLLVQNLVSEDTGSLFARVYTLKNGAFSYESYSAPLGSASLIGIGSRGSIREVLPGRGGRIALVFDTYTTATPQIRVSGSSGLLTVRMLGIRLPEDFVLPTSLSEFYMFNSISQVGEDTLLSLSLSGNVKRYRMHINDPIAGSKPYIEIELVTEESDYPEGW